MDQIAAKRAKVVVENNNNNCDRISSLPDAILQKILSLLPPKHATATSILSRRWETLWLSFPVIDLNQSDFTNRRKFNLCLKSTSSSHNFSDLKTLRLRVNNDMPSSPRLNRRVCKFMNVVLRDGKILEELNIQFVNPLLYRYQHMGLLSEKLCTLPNETFSSCSHLIFLKVEGCRFEGCPRVDLPELKTLHMKNVFIHEEFLVELVHACPVVETLSIEFCYGIVNVRIVHSKLQYLVLGFRNNLETLELDMPDVKCINFNALVNSLTEEGFINVLGYQNSRKIQARNLETLRLECLILEPEVLHNLISIFPKMEKLDMTECVLSGQVELNSKSLTSLGMTECVLLGEVYIKACNLRDVEYLHDPEGFQLNYNTMKYVRRLSLFNLEELEFGTLWIKGSIFCFLVCLELSFCSSMKQLKIVSNTLESLEVLWCEHLKNCHIVAPKLSTFSFSGEAVHMIHLDTSKELHVTLHLEEPDSYDYDDHHDHVRFVKRFVGFLQNVGASAASMAIELGYSCTECLMMIKAIDLPPTSLVQHVKFDTPMDIDEIGLRDLLSCLLGISIYCNKLSINLGWFSFTLQFQEIKKKKACVGKTELGRIEDHLVRVEMKSFTGSDEQVDLARFFVRKARHMQKMTICMKRGEEEDATRKCLDAFHRKLRIFQRFDIVSYGDCVSFSRNAI